jgi:AcrR family transcriptional regulator
MKTHGLKSLTMDLVAAELSMSKRTLYQIFESKTQFISDVIDLFFQEHRQACADIFDNAPNTMLAVAGIFMLQCDHFKETTLSFFRDMETLYPKIGEYYRARHEEDKAHWEQIYQKGIEEGMFRSDVNCILLIKMLDVQMRAVKRSENILKDFTLEEIFGTITMGFLRSIATAKGGRILDKYLADKDFLIIQHPKTENSEG